MPKWWPVTTWAFFWFISIFEHFNRAVLNARLPDIEEITPHLLAGAITPGTFIIKNLVGAWSGPWRLGTSNKETLSYITFYTSFDNNFGLIIPLREC